MRAPEVPPDPGAPLLSCHLPLFLRDFSLSQSRLQSGGFFLYFSYFLGQVGHLVQGPLGCSPRENKQAQRCNKDSRHLIYSHGRESRFIIPCCLSEIVWEVPLGCSWIAFSLYVTRFSSPGGIRLEAAWPAQTDGLAGPPKPFFLIFLGGDS